MSPLLKEIVLCGKASIAHRKKFFYLQNAMEIKKNGWYVNRAELLKDGMVEVYALQSKKFKVFSQKIRFKVNSRIAII